MDRRTGQERWRHPFDGSFRYVIAGGSVVVSDNDDGGVEVLDVVTGVTRWRAAGSQDVVVHGQAVYARDCVGVGVAATCVITGRELDSGRQLWKLPSDRFARVSDVTLGARPPYAPATGRYVVVRLSTSARAATYTPVVPTTGRTGVGRLPNRAWFGFAADDLLVSTDHDPPKGTSAARSASPASTRTPVPRAGPARSTAGVGRTASAPSGWRTTAAGRS